VLSKTRMLDLFEQLNDELAKKKVKGEVFIVGGAAMALAYNSRPSTQDVDGIWEPSTVVRDAAKRVATNNDDVDADWLNDGVKGFLPGEDKGESKVVFEASHLSVSAASPEYILATKILASRVSRDEDDILTLYDLLGLETAEQGFEIFERYYPKTPVEAKVRFFLEELIAKRT
jgi:hypothetical protein